MSSIGETLRVERLRRGLSLEQISERTKITLRHLEAIEADELEKLPGSFFARSFLRQYGKALGLDEGVLESELDQLTEHGAAATPPETPWHQPEVPPITSGLGNRSLTERVSLGSVAGFVLVVLACSGLYTLWERAHRSPGPGNESATAAAQKSIPTAGTAQRPAPEALPPKVEPEAQNAVHTATAQPQKAPAPAPEPQVAAVSQPAAASKPADPVESAGAGQAAAVPPDSRIHLQLGATEDTWVRVTSDEKIVFMGTLTPGQTRVFHGLNSMKVRTGNAGALEIAWNGRAVGQIGPKGQIRVVEFTPERHKVIEHAPHPPMPPDIF